MSLGSVIQVVVLVRTVIDTVRSLLSLRSRKRTDDVIPVYRLVTHGELPRARSDLAIDVTSGFVPR